MGHQLINAMGKEHKHTRPQDPHPDIIGRTQGKVGIEPFQFSFGTRQFHGSTPAAFNEGGEVKQGK